MSRRHSVTGGCASLALVVITAALPAVAQQAPQPSPAQPTAPAAATPAAAPTAPATTPLVDPVVITAPAPAAAPASPPPTAPGAQAPVPAATTPPATPTPRWVPRASSASPAAASAPSVPDVGARRVPAPAATPARELPPPASPFWAMAVFDHRWSTARAFDLFADQDVTHFYGAALGYDVLTLVDAVTLTAELGWNTGSVDRDDLTGAFSGSALTTHNVQLGVNARYEVLSWLAPTARVALGVSSVAMDLESQADNTRYQDSAWAPMLGFGVGVLLQTPPRALQSRSGDFGSLRLGVRVELGYTLAGQTAFALAGDDDVRVPFGETSLGGLPRSGAHVHSALFIRL